MHDSHPIKDNQGEDLPDDEAAWKEATSFTGAVFKGLDGKFRPGEQWSVEVTDEAGKPVFFISIGSRKMK